MTYAAVSKVMGLATLCSLLAMAGTTHAQDAKVITAWDQQTNASSSKILRDASDRFEQKNPGYKVTPGTEGAAFQV